MTGPRLGFCALVVAILLDCSWIGFQLRSSGSREAKGPVAATGVAEQLSDPTTSPQQSPQAQSVPVKALGVPQSAQLVIVVDHVDGDTLKVSVPVAGPRLQRTSELTVRLLEIDTPESVDPTKPVQCFAHRATTALTRLLPIGGKAWAVGDRQSVDPYGRELLYIWTEDGTFVNLELVKRGYARAVLYEPNDAYISAMRRAQKEAKSSMLGVWSHCDHLVPLLVNASRSQLRRHRAREIQTQEILIPDFPIARTPTPQGTATTS